MIEEYKWNSVLKLKFKEYFILLYISHYRFFNIIKIQMSK